MMRSLSAGLLFCGSECTKVSQLWEKKPKKLTRQGEFSHHEQVCVKLFKVTQAIHRWTRGVVVRQDDDIVIFRGGWALLSFDVAGYTREVPFKLIFHYNNNFACRNHQISHKASALPPQWKAEASFAHALSRIAVGLFSHMQCTAADIYCQTCFVWGRGRNGGVDTPSTAAAHTSLNFSTSIQHLGAALASSSLYPLDFVMSGSLFSSTLSICVCKCQSAQLITPFCSSVSFSRGSLFLSLREQQMLHTLVSWQVYIIRNPALECRPSPGIFVHHMWRTPKPDTAIN